MDVRLREVNVIVVGLSLDQHCGFEVIVAEYDLVFVGSRFLRNELEHELFALSYLEDALLLAELKA
jgi:hypothetical protein